MTACKVYSYDVKEVSRVLEGKELENKKKWTKILRGMSADQIKEILGEPERIVEGVTTIWFYPKGGSVSFVDVKVVKYIRPFNWDF